ncbi:MAG TPA: lysine 5,6-aminomutase subunit alpha [Thermoleophilia bacterium]|nr:MAG: D-lysine 5,6-aminomutase alpha subunit [Actinobacteria bacterium ADurb.BinA094]HOU28194.1 lysine 5,6-aminomutase subunit alpha [Thermoleophilia bacterium]HQF52204.1 lysine 5,6-aminomutase subunit alpha [Thermoleophilia bacterium]
MSDALQLNGDLVDRARAAADAIADDIQRHIDEHTTDTTERASLRLLGITGVNEIDVPLVNVVVEHARSLLPSGILRPFVDLMDRTGRGAQEVAEGVAAGELTLAPVPPERCEGVEARAEALAREGVARIDAVRARRNELVATVGEPPKPYVYVIVATGNIYEDAAQAKAAARAGADVIAVIRTTAQSLLDYVPYGETTEGFGGTYATQENFRLMRAALDEVGEELGRYVRLCNYASGLCMPEIATMGALERLDMMLNDSMYGIIFRNINMQRTFVDQYLSRLINARAGIVINTGEDNYLTTADAFEAGHTVVSSDFINEAFALRANLEPWQIGLGHAFEIDPAKPDQVVYQIADAQLIRQLFPGYPLKYMPPTKYMPGDIFQGHIIDGMFNFTGILTGQEIMLLGMLTEALHTPLLQDRYVSIRNAKYVFEACRHLADEISYKPSGLIERRADEQLRRAVEQLEHVRSIGLFKALQNGEFADVKRDPDGGRGFEGVIKVAPDYFNPFFAALREGRMSGPPRGTERSETTAGDSAVAGGGD